MLPDRPFALERYYGLHEHAVARQLSASDCEARTLGDLLARTGTDPAAVLDRRLGYTTARGSPALRAAIAFWYPACTADDVLVANAPQEAILLAMRALLSPGDRVVVQTPCYQSLAAVAEALGCELAPWPVRATTSGFAFSLDELERLLARPTRLLVTNLPHNPTGAHATPAEWQRLAAIVQQHGVRWFSDEIYRGLAPDDARELPPAASLCPTAISLWGLSKSFGLPGLRLGWLCARDRALLERIEQWKDWTSICTNSLSELAGELALRAAAGVFAENRARIAANAVLMREFAGRHQDLLAWQPPAAGPVSLARVLRGTASELAESVRLRGSALLVPSRLFDLEDCYVRIGLGRADFADALARWEGALRA